MTDYEPVTEYAELLAGRRVRFQATLSEIPWQHLISLPEDYSQIAYVDFDGIQIVAYFRERPNARPPQSLMLAGEVLEVRGQSKRPGSADVHVELQIKVEHFQAS